MATRLDIALRLWGFTPSRAKAQELIERGDVEFYEEGAWHRATSPSEIVEESSREKFRLRSRDALRFVSRGGLKLQGALDQARLNIGGWRCLDVGVSTGGFTDCLLQNGAARVVGID